mmetsp:Transcript_112459/g.312894  ORF Transcript_112459/g.312894 Transcript_112459/m.312894 type:complete len:227 (+) Transcript_112459:979-1659(+)
MRCPKDDHQAGLRIPPFVNSPTRSSLAALRYCSTSKQSLAIAGSPKFPQRYTFFNWLNWLGGKIRLTSATESSAWCSESSGFTRPPRSLRAHCGQAALHCVVSSKCTFCTAALRYKGSAPASLLNVCTHCKSTSLYAGLPSVAVSPMDRRRGNKSSISPAPALQPRSSCDRHKLRNTCTDAALLRLPTALAAVLPLHLSFGALAPPKLPPISQRRRNDGWAMEWVT